MNFNISSATLFSVLQNASRVISPKQTMPILDHFLFELRDCMLTVTATDLESTIIADVEVDTACQDGIAAIPSRIIIDALRELSDQPVSIVIEPDSNTLELKWLSGEIAIPCNDGLGFPEVDRRGGLDAKSVVLSSSELIAGVTKTIFAAANSEARPTINGVLMDVTPESIVFVATDTFQLVKLALDKSVVCEEPAMVIITKKSAALLKNLVTKDSGDITVSFGGKNISFEFAGYTYISRVIEGRYPNYNSVIPKGSPCGTTIDRSAFLNCIKRVSVCSNQSTNLIKLCVSEDVMNLEAQDIDFSVSARDSITCASHGFEGEVVIGLKSKNLIDMLSVLSSDEISLEFTDPTRPILFSPVNSNDDYEKGMVVMLMPVSI